MNEERKEANERVKNTLIRKLPKDKYDNDVVEAKESDLTGYNVLLRLERLNTEDTRGQIKEILEDANPYLYNRTKYVADFVKMRRTRALQVHIRMVASKKMD